MIYGLWAYLVFIRIKWPTGCKAMSCPDNMEVHSLLDYQQILYFTKTLASILNVKTLLHSLTNFRSTTPGVGYTLNFNNNLQISLI